MFITDFKLKRTHLLSATILMLASSAACSQGNHLFIDTHAIQNEHENSFSELPTTESVEFMKANASLVSAKNTDIVLEVESGLLLTAHQRDFKVNTDGTSVWIGTIQDSKYSSADELMTNEVILVRHGDKITGSINIDDDLYMISPLADGNHAIIKTDTSKFPEYGNDTIKTPSAHHHNDAHHKNKKLKNDLTNKNTRIKIRVMTATTIDSRARESDMPGLIALSIARANEGFRNSNINIEYENAGILNLDYSEQGLTNSALLAQMNDKKSTLGAAVQTFRDTQLADLAVLITSDWKSTCGTAYLNASKATALSAVAWNCSAANLTFGHETGHNLGANHKDGYKQLQQTPGWRTTMADANNCTISCPKINHYSNPDINYNQLPTGTANQNSASILNQNAQKVANFYPPMTNFQQVGELAGSATLPARQFFQTQLKDTSSNQTLSSFDLAVSSDMYTWPTEMARAINGHFPETTFRAGEMDSNGDINVIPYSSYRNRLWLNKSLVGKQQLQLTRDTYAEALGSKWVSKFSQGLDDAIPGTEKHAVLRNTSTNQELARIVLPITSTNNSVYQWSTDLAQKINAATPAMMRAGEMQADGSIKVIIGSSYRNRIWVQLGQSSQLVVTIETRDAKGNLIN